MPGVWFWTEVTVPSGEVVPASIFVDESVASSYGELSRDGYVVACACCGERCFIDDDDRKMPCCGADV